MTVFFRYFFRERQKDNEINALHSTQNGLYDPLYRENRSFGISCHTPAVSGAFPPCQIHHARRCVRPFPLAHHKTPALACVHSPSPNLSHLLKADVYSPSPFMEMGGRKAGGEVQIEKKITSEKNFLTPPSTTRISRPRRRDETSPWHDENRKEESDREI